MTFPKVPPMIEAEFRNFLEAHREDECYERGGDAISLSIEPKAGRKHIRVLAFKLGHRKATWTAPDASRVPVQLPLHSIKLEYRYSKRGVTLNSICTSQNLEWSEWELRLLVLMRS